MCEQSIIGARASVMVYDDMQKKWVPSGSSSGLSKVQIYHHQQNNTFRVVGRKLQDHEVVINCSILKGLKYNQATATFHQWRDSKFVYGLNFSSQQDAEAFARAMMHALEVLSGRVIPSSAPPPPQPSANSTAYEEDMGYRTMTREDAAIIQQQQQIVITASGPVVPSPQTPTSQNQQNILQSPPTQGHHRTSRLDGCAPPAPQPPPMVLAQHNFTGSASIVQPNQQLQQQLVAGQQYQHPSYSTNNAFGSLQNATPNNQPIYVSSNLTQNINQQPIIHQQSNQNGTMYVSSAASSVSGVQTTSLFSCNQSQQSTPVYGQTNGQTNGQASYSGSTIFPVNTPIAVQSQIMSGMVCPPQAPPPPPPFNTGNTNLIISQLSTSSSMNVSTSVSNSHGAPPPPPPPPMNCINNKPEGMDMSSLAAQLQNAKLKRNQKTTPPPAENSGSSTSSGGSGNYGTIGRSTSGMASMMDEMAKTLARRRAQAEKKEPDSTEDITAGRQRPWEKSNTLPHKLGTTNPIATSASNNNTISGSNPIGSESPRLQRKRFGSASEETILRQVNGDALSLPFSAELDNIRAELVREMRIEINKAKQEIIDAIKSEFNRR